MLLSSAAFAHLCDCRFGAAEAYHADGNCYADSCDTAQSLLPGFAGLNVQSHRDALAPLPEGQLGPAWARTIRTRLSEVRYANYGVPRMERAPATYACRQG